jgi:hypothetical protein
MWLLRKVVTPYIASILVGFIFSISLMARGASMMGEDVKVWVSSELYWHGLTLLLAGTVFWLLWSMMGGSVSGKEMIGTKKYLVISHVCLGGPFCAFEEEVRKLLKERPDGMAKGEIVGRFVRLSYQGMKKRGSK